MSLHSEDDEISLCSESSDEQPDCDHDVNKDGTSSSGSSNGGSSSGEGKVKFVQKESRQVLLLRIGVIMVLLLAATAVSILVFFISKKAEKQSMESNYEAAAEKILYSFMDIAQVKMGTAGSLVVSIVAHALATGQSWPFVTVPSFQERASTTMKLSGALYFGINPVVPGHLRDQWENYTSGEASKWFRESLEYQHKLGLDSLDNRPQIVTDDSRLDLSGGIANYIFDYDRETVGAKGFIAAPSTEYHPIWQTSPVTNRTMINQNRATNSVGSLTCLRENAVIFLGMQYSVPGFGDDKTPKTAEMAWLLGMANRQPTEYPGDIFSTIYFPLYSDFSNERHTVGVVRVVFHWARYFERILPDSKQGVVFVVENGCDEPYTYQIDGGVVTPLGHGDLHDRGYEKYMRTASFKNITWIEDGTVQGLQVMHAECPYQIRVYPSARFADDYGTKTPFIVTFCVAAVFLFTVFTFFFYDTLVERRQRLLLQKATQTHKIVSSLFPKNVRDRMLEEGEEHVKRGGFMAPNQRLKTFLTDGDKATSESQVIADLFPHATILFADISGFTAWSSSREPSQVFILLQSVYQAFDKIAKQRKVFKVETIGDSYVAVTGCPEPQVKHAVIMARFAMECAEKMTDIVRNLETSLGPDTGDLKMRFGMNSGPVTAGVLRGERSRFQLFGDTMNTASRMESTGIPGKIQASQTTADILIASGKGHWVTKREDNVVAKGKGILQTYWITPRTWNGTSNASSDTASANNDTEDIHTLDNDEKTSALLKREREIDWIVQVLLDRIRPVIAKHQAQNKTSSTAIMPRRDRDHTALDEVKDAIALPEFDSKVLAVVNCNTIEISRELTASLREYVSIIASTYRDNPFHNFEHACHVTMSADKFLKRIISPKLEESDLVKIKDETALVKKVALHLHDYTHGIHSDPITMLAIVFSALIHDADHRGISNTQLIKEEPNMGALFRNKSVAEQNSLEIAWSLLMSDRFKGLRDYIFCDTDELLRFRQVVVNAVLATDIFDKEFNDLRKARWDKAFHESVTPAASAMGWGATRDNAKGSSNSISSNMTNALRATIVLEHIIQASDVCHTMQHWHVYRKWNRNLFFELTKAYRSGRLGADPATFWYQGELNFFDSYIFPLAQKLKDCNVFGVSSDECLNYALLNRAEWKVRGEALVEEMVEEFNRAPR